MTIPVANPQKVKQRRKQSSKRNLYPEDDFNRSYVLDLEAPVTANNNNSSSNNNNNNSNSNNNNSNSSNNNSKKNSKSRKRSSKAARDKKRELEGKFGKSGSKINNTDDTLDMNLSSEGSMDFDLEMNHGHPKKLQKTKSADLSGYMNGQSNNSSASMMHMSANNGMQGKKKGGSQDSWANGSGDRRVVKMRDTDRLLRPSRGRGMERLDLLSSGMSGGNRGGNGGGGGGGGGGGSAGGGSVSSARSNTSQHTNKGGGGGGGGGQTMVRQNSQHSLNNAQRQNSQKGVPQRGRSMDRQSSQNHNHNNNNNNGGGGMQRQKSMPQRGRSVDRSNSMSNNRTSHSAMSRSKSMDRSGHSAMSRSKTMDRSGFERNNNSARPPQTFIPSKMKRSRSQSMDGGSRRGGLSRSNSRRSVMSNQSVMSNATVVKDKYGKTVFLVPVTSEQAKRLPNGRVPLRAGGKNYVTAFGKKIEVEETPPKSLVLIWVVVSAELAFDLATTIIAFQALRGADNCCGNDIELGFIPMSVTTPFFLLLVAELAFLLRAMMLTMWPSIMTGSISEEDREFNQSRSSIMRWCCCCLRWNAKFVMQSINFLVLLNPFFGCVIAWMLLYQSDKVESFIVLGLEGASIILHFISIWLEGSCTTCCGFMFHCIPLIPFIVSVTLILVYLKQGGVCYLVNEKVFLFTGCELCPDRYPPLDGMCNINGTNVTIGETALFDVDFGSGNLDALRDDITNSNFQAEYCQDDFPDGPDVDFCFFPF